ncbi:hypothetical protein [Hydrogenophaga aquatica]
MRALTLWLMMCLLPLRLLAGDAMAVQAQVAGGHMPAASMPKAQAAPQASRDCHGQTVGKAMSHHAHGQTDTASPASADKAHPGHAMCGLCDVCHSTLHAATAVSLPAQELPRVLPAALTPRLSSAEPLPGFKPPIA